MPWYRMLTLSTPGSYTLTGVVNGPGGYSACIDQVGAGFGALTVNVLPNPPPAVACNITADKNSIMTDEDTNLRYSVSGATSCSLNGTSISPNNGNDSAEKIAGGNWSDAKIFTLSCTDGTTSCTSKTVVNKLCWCAGGSFRTSDVLASKSDAANCAKEIQKWYPVLGPQCATDARYGVCSCKGVVPVSYPGYHYPELSGPKNCRCFNPGEGRFTWAGQIYKP